MSSKEEWRDDVEKLEKLFGTDVRPTLQNIQGIDVVLSEILSHSYDTYQVFAISHQLDTHTDTTAYFESLFEKTERLLTKRFGEAARFSTVSELQALADTLYTLRPSSHDPGLALTEHAAQTLLTAVSPLNLMRSFGAHDLNGLWDALTPLEALALTRHTEDSSWQEQYLDALGNLSRDAFEERDVRIHCIARDTIAPALQAVGRSFKPWAMSHSKEAGMITFFTFGDTAQKVPLTLRTLLFLHYYFETLRTQRSLAARAHAAPHAVGEHIKKIILSTRRTFSFLNPNIHSEALYWKDAIAHFAHLFPELEYQTLLSLLEVGISNPPQDIISMNVVDRLWDKALGKKDGNYLYHFRETLWSELLRRLRDFSHDDMRATILDTLDLDDVAFTEHMLDQIDKKG